MKFVRHVRFSQWHAAPLLAVLLVQAGCGSDSATPAPDRVSDHNAPGDQGGSVSLTFHYVVGAAGATSSRTVPIPNDLLRDPQTGALNFMDLPTGNSPALL